MGLERKNLRWTVKVNKLITHTFKFSERLMSCGKSFKVSLLPPSMTPKTIQTLENFIAKTGLGKRFALEVRNMKWFDKTYIEWASKLNITWVSIDSPDFPLNVYRKARQESYGLTLG
jgi:uncharacterized protein YecE (DUF72 family)